MNHKPDLELVVLGSSNAVPDENHENAHLVLNNSQRLILIDCSGHPTIRLKQAGLDYRQLSDLILTHFHPDHVSSVPPFLMNLWLLGRTQPLSIHGLEHTLQRVESMLELFDWHSWPGFFPVRFHRLPEEELAPVLESDGFRIYASPVRHIIPTIGLRIVSNISGRVLAYSADTEPCPEVIRLAEGSHVLIHEATGETYGHSSARQAGEVARQAGAGRLMLIHYSALDKDSS
ncbi:MAG: MBL fold metallo-hydrolase, partial [Anaerolineales bacterium]